MTKVITPTGPVNARIHVPGSKSITNRALVCAALAGGESLLSNASDSDDTALLANGLNQMGVLARPLKDGMLVQGAGGVLAAPRFPIPVANAGTTLRFLLSLAALAKGRVVFEGSERMAERPIEELTEALASLGCDARKTEGIAHYEVDGGSLRGGVVKLRGDRSSQFISSLLMVVPYAPTDVQIRVDGPLVSASYVDLTIAVMRHFGVEVTQEKGPAFRVQAGQRYRPAAFAVEADASSATYPLAAAAITGGKVMVEGLNLTSHQGDIGFIDILRIMGCHVEDATGGVSASGEGKLHGLDVDMNQMPDAVPTVAVMALFAGERTTIRNVAQLRHKESDRLEALSTELGKLGGNVRVLHDGLEITPAPLHGARLDTHDDHRMAMSFALAGLRVPGVEVENPECVKKSFPRYWEEFEKFYKV